MWNRLKNVFSHMKIRTIVIGILNICIAIAIIILTIVLSCGKNSLPDQLEAKRWSEEKDTAQVSCFFSKQAEVSEDFVAELRYKLDKALVLQAIEPKNENARLYADAYYGVGKLDITRNKTVCSAKAIGIGGDFFLFHPLKLVSGNYFSGNDLMQDSVILDEEAAWQLFGSSNVAGMEVTINGLPYRVAGVIQREQGKLETMAGNGEVTVYVSFGSLKKFAEDTAIEGYEIVMPNPVDDFASGLLKENIGLDEQFTDIVDNTARFSYKRLYQIYKLRASRGMKTNDIIYPYWENLARVKEERLMEVALWQVILLGIFALYWIVMGIIFLIRHKPTKEKIEHFFEKTKMILSKRKKKKVRSSK